MEVDFVERIEFVKQSGFEYFAFVFILQDLFEEKPLFGTVIKDLVIKESSDLLLRI